MVLSGDLSAGLRHRRRTAVQIAWLSYASSSAACAPENVRVVDTKRCCAVVAQSAARMLRRPRRVLAAEYKLVCLESKASKAHTIFKRADSCEVRGEISDRSQPSILRE